MFELHITLKHHESGAVYKRPFTVYEECKVSEDDPVIRRYIAQAVKEFGRIPDDSKFRINSVIVNPLALLNESEVVADYEGNYL